MLGSRSSSRSSTSIAIPASTTSLTFDQVNLAARKIASEVLISTEVAEDSLPEMVDEVVNALALDFATKEDDYAFNGDGTSTYQGMYGLSKIILDGNHAKAKVVAASGHNTFANIDATDLGNLMASVRASAIPNAAWFCSQSCFAASFVRLSMGSGFLETRIVDGIYTPYFQGFPVILSQKLPLSTSSLSGSVMLAFGDMYAAGILGQRRGVTVKRSADAKMDLDQIVLLGTERFHSVVHDVGDNSLFGSIAALVGN